MARPVHPGFSPLVERFFGATDQAFGLPKRIYCDNSREFLSTATLEAYIQNQVEILFGALPTRAGEDPDVT
jgi:hypothetical protein